MASLHAVLEQLEQRLPHARLLVRGVGWASHSARGLRDVRRHEHLDKHLLMAAAHEVSQLARRVALDAVLEAKEPPAGVTHVERGEFVNHLHVPGHHPCAQRQCVPMQKREARESARPTDAPREAGACHVAAHTAGWRAHGGCIHRLRVGEDAGAEARADKRRAAGPSILRAFLYVCATVFIPKAYEICPVVGWGFVR